MMLWWALLAIPLVVLYVLKVRVRRVPVSTLMFWERVYEEKAPRSLWERLRHLLSLLFQLVLLALLVLALSDPIFDWQEKNARQVVLVIDNSASMQATDVAPSRLAEAKRGAVDLLSGLRPRDRMAILAAGGRPEVVVGMTGHVRTLKEAIESVPSSDGPGRVAEAVELARRLIAGKKNGQIVVFTDAAFPEAESVATGKKVTWEPVGGEAANAGITRFQARRSLNDPIGYELLVEVTNTGEAVVETRLDLELASQVIDAVPLTLEPGEVWRQTFQKASADGGSLIATLAWDDSEQNAGDALAVDDIARAILPQREPRPVYLVTKGNVFLQSAFQASPLVNLGVVKELPAKRPSEALVVFHRDVPQSLPDGPVLVIDPRGSTDVWTLGGKIENPVVAEQAEDSPLLAHVELGKTRMPEARRLELKEGLESQVLAATAEGEPLLVAVDRPNGKLLVLTVNLDKGDLPLRTAFPILLTNALAWYADGAGEFRESVSAGSLVELQVDPATQYVLQSPDGLRRALPNSGETITIGPLEQTGLWHLVPRDQADEADVAGDRSIGETLASRSEGVIEIACNLADPVESDLAPKYEDTRQVEPTFAGWAGRPVWFYLLVGVSILIPAEWLLYQRRWIQ